MNAQEILDSPDFKRCAEFHGHICPGLSIGYRATKLAMQKLQENRALDEELVAIVENDSCAVDAVQVVTGCTFGKGNLVFHDHGKHVYTFAIRPTGQSVRLSLRPDGGPGDGVSREERAHWIVHCEADELFEITRLTISLPAEAEIHQSVICQNCGEPVMDTRTCRVGDRIVCRPCAQRLS